VFIVRGAYAIQRRFDAIFLPRNEIKGLLNAWNGNLHSKKEGKAKQKSSKN
jgi:hypothetical protein